MYVVLNTTVNETEYTIECDGETKEDIKEKAGVLATSLGVPHGTKWSVSRSRRVREVNE